MTQKIIKVEGMSCEHCRNAVESALAKLNGIKGMLLITLYAF